MPLTFSSSLAEMLVGGRSESVRPHRDSAQRAGARRPVLLQTVPVQEPLHQGLPHPPPQVSVGVSLRCGWTVATPD